jgi:ABC-type multidrug transport system fused ATPase/permease subunit
MIKSPKHIVDSITQRQIMSYLALFFSVIGSAVFSAMAMWIVWIVWRGGWAVSTENVRLEILGKTLEMALFGSLVVVISFGFLIGMRTIKLGPSGVLMSSDEDHIKSIDDSVQQIADNTDPTNPDVVKLAETKADASADTKADAGDKKDEPDADADDKSDDSDDKADDKDTDKK